MSHNTIQYNMEMKEQWCVLEYFPSSTSAPIFCGTFKTRGKMERRMTDLVNQRQTYEMDGFKGTLYMYDPFTLAYKAQTLWSPPVQEKENGEHEDIPDGKTVYILQHEEDHEIIEVTATFDAAIERAQEIMDRLDLSVDDLDDFSCAEYTYNEQTHEWEYVDTWDVAGPILGEDAASASSTEEDVDSDSDAEDEEVESD